MFVFLSIVLMTVDHRLGSLESIRSGLSALVYPLQYLVSLPVEAGRGLSASLSSHANLLAENDRLRTRQLLMGAKLQKYEALEVENMRLRELLQSSFKVGERVVIAELLSVELDPFSRQVVINKGSADGVYVGQPIVDADGIMGQVVRVNSLSATVMLITDPAHALPVEVNRSGLRTLAIGGGPNGQLELSHVPGNADIRQGDLIVASGLGGRFPRGYPVGIVTAIEHDRGQAFSRIAAAPTASLDRSREVLLVWSARRGGAVTEGPRAAGTQPPPGPAEAATQ